eukprot:239458_1
MAQQNKQRKADKKKKSVSSDCASSASSSSYYSSSYYSSSAYSSSASSSYSNSSSQSCRTRNPNGGYNIYIILKTHRVCRMDGTLMVKVTTKRKGTEETWWCERSNTSGLDNLFNAFIENERKCREYGSNRNKNK